MHGGNRRTAANQPAGGIDGKGYVRIGIDGGQYRAHRLAWLYVHGVWPKSQIDHINRNRRDNRICNLREATGTQNNGNMPARNVSSKYKGVGWHKETRKWRAFIRIKGKAIHLGVYNYEFDAHEAYMSAAKAYFGEFASAA